MRASIAMLSSLPRRASRSQTKSISPLLLSSSACVLTKGSRARRSGLNCSMALLIWYSSGPAVRARFFSSASLLSFGEVQCSQPLSFAAVDVVMDERGGNSSLQLVGIVFETDEQHAATAEDVLTA